MEVPDPDSSYSGCLVLTGLPLVWLGDTYGLRLPCVSHHQKQPGQVTFGVQSQNPAGRWVEALSRVSVR